MSYKRLIVLAVAVMLIVCLSAFSAFSYDISRVQVWGIYSGESSGTYHRMLTMAFGQNEFGYKPESPISNVTYVSYFLTFPKTNINSFSLDIYDEYAYSSLSSYGANNIWFGLSNSMTHNVTAVTNYTASAADVGWNLHWDYSDGTNNDEFDTLRVSYRVGTTVLSASYWHKFKINNFTINGVSADEIGINQTSDDLSTQISQLHNDELAMWGQIVAPVLSESFNDQQINEAMTQSGYYSLLTSVSMNNFIVPAMLLIVATMAFYSYAIFGRKG